MTLHITNGSCACDLLRSRGIPGEYLPWDDVLHEGPLSSGLTLDEMSRVRARFLSQHFWGSEPDTLTRLRQRNRRLHDAAHAGEDIILWGTFELFDQLIVLQVLNWYTLENHESAHLSIIHVPDNLGVDTHDGDELQRMLAHRHAIDDDMIRLAVMVWDAVCEAEPTALTQLLNQNLHALPYLHGAVARLAQEFPANEDGLSRTERQALTILLEGPCAINRLFNQSQRRENPAFMGDASFWRILADLSQGPQPLLLRDDGERFMPPAYPSSVETLNATRVELTETGRQVLSGRMNRLDVAPIDRWVGGVHLHRPDVWCWDPKNHIFSRHHADHG